MQEERQRVPKKKHTHVKKSAHTSKQLRARKERARRLRKKRWLMEQRRKQARKRTIRMALVSIGSGLFFMAIVFFYFFSVTKVYGYSMLPTLDDGDVVIVNRRQPVTRYQLIAFRTVKGDVIVRRVIGLPGEKVELRQGKLYVNDEERVEFYLTKESVPTEEATKLGEFSGQEVEGIQSVPKNTYYVLGDNRSYATDSRYFGPVAEDQVIGVISMRESEGE
ncbi:signal peptidase I [Enterococcus sp. JM4C]|uniref:signal peptidase I n=1 Tax=Candidatus Enterococcus huntleyi TaxID=1857217 RepID=UPI00137B2ED7|nr:signal peptidase I [Enterococcus sp. JM4C]KAF1297830.1 signal peptidase I [Enterococcus sp. JM4C]